MPEENKAATTVKELGIELQGFKEVVSLKFDNLNAEITRLVGALEDATTTKASQRDLEELIVRVVVLETKKPWVLVVTTVILTSVLTFFIQFEITNLLGGK